MVHLPLHEGLDYKEEINLARGGAGGGTSPPGLPLPFLAVVWDVYVRVHLCARLGKERARERQGVDEWCRRTEMGVAERGRSRGRSVLRYGRRRCSVHPHVSLPLFPALPGTHAHTRVPKCALFLSLGKRPEVCRSTCVAAGSGSRRRREPCACLRATGAEGVGQTHVHPPTHTHTHTLDCVLVGCIAPVSLTCTSV